MQNLSGTPKAWVVTGCTRNATCRGGQPGVRGAGHGERFPVVIRNQTKEETREQGRGSERPTLTGGSQGPTDNPGDQGDDPFLLDD